MQLTVGRVTIKNNLTVLCQLTCYIGLQKVYHMIPHDVGKKQYYGLNLHPQYVFCILKYNALHVKQPTSGSNTFIANPSVN